MNFLVRLKNFIDERDQKSYYRMIGIFFSIIIIVLAVLLYWHSHKIAALQKELKNLHTKRTTLRTLLGEYEHVALQKNNIKKILDEESSFRIKQYFDQAVAEVNLAQKVSKEEIIDPQDLQNGYNEIKLDVSFSGITMQDLVTLLDGKIEKSKRIYTKELVIIKNPAAKTFDVTLVLATLQPKPSPS